MFDLMRCPGIEKRGCERSSRSSLCLFAPISLCPIPLCRPTPEIVGYVYLTNYTEHIRGVHSAHATCTQPMSSSNAHASGSSSREGEVGSARARRGASPGDFGMSPLYSAPSSMRDSLLASLSALAAPSPDVWRPQPPCPSRHRRYPPLANAPGPSGSAVAAATAIGADVSRYVTQRSREAVQAASSWVELVALWPGSYREGVKPLMKEIWELAGSYAGATEAFERLSVHQKSPTTARTYPQHYAAVRIPAMQTSSEFGRTNDALSFKRELEDTVRNAKEAMLDVEYRARSNEVHYLQTRLDPQKWVRDLHAVIERIYARDVPQPFALEPPSLGGALGDGDVVMGDGGALPPPPARDSWTVTKGARDERTFARNLAMHLIPRMMVVRRGAVANHREKQHAKESLKRAADTSAGASVPANLKQVVKAQVQAALASTSKGSVSIASVSLDIFLNPFTQTSSAKPKAPVAKPSGGGPTRSSGSKRPSSAAKRAKKNSKPYSTAGSGATADMRVVRRVFNLVGAQEDRSEDRAGRKREGEGQSESLADLLVKVLVSPWEYDRPSTYPDEILDLPSSVAQAVVWSRAPLELIESARFARGCSHGPECICSARVTCTCICWS